MTKPALVSDDPLVMKVRVALKTIEPRTYPTETRHNIYGTECWICPYCGELCFMKGGKDKMGNFNMHFAGTHSTPFWKERRLIALFRRESLSETRNLLTTTEEK
jgi:hypothetical protein